MIGGRYEKALAGAAVPGMEWAAGAAGLRPAAGSLPGDESVLGRCAGPTLEVGDGSGRLTVALAERGVPVLAVDLAARAVTLTRSSGALALHRDVFDHLPGAGRWATVLLADGAIGIGGDPAALLRRAGELLRPEGTVLAEASPPGSAWVRVDARDLVELAGVAGLRTAETWASSGRWFARLRRAEGG
jgi:SAM-dependent methyltransferase